MSKTSATFPEGEKSAFSISPIEPLNVSAQSDNPIPQIHIVAVDPKVIPLGTKLYIQSLDGTKDYGFAIAEDTGGAIKGNKIDLFFESSEQVYKFGRRKVKVYILK